jgi:hypothetical protein
MFFSTHHHHHIITIRYIQVLLVSIGHAHLLFNNEVFAQIVHIVARTLPPHIKVFSQNVWHVCQLIQSK